MMNSIKKLVRASDMFGEPIPSFNLGGDHRVTTIVGGLTSMFILGITFLFSLVQLQHLLQRANPIINIIKRKEALL